MSNEQKTAIQGAEKRLEQERREKLQNEIYQFLKSELDEVDRIDGNIKELSGEKRIHEENIKNVKQGNLKAIEDRRRSLVNEGYFLNPTLSLPKWNITYSSSSGTNFYSSYVAGMSVRTTNGKLYVF